MLFSLFLASLAAVSPCLGSSNLHGGLGKRQSNSRLVFGLTDNNNTIADTGITWGFHIDWMQGERPDSYNNRLGKTASVFGGYVHLQEGNISYSELELITPHVVPLKENSVFSPAIIPEFSLDGWTEEITAGLVEQFRLLNEAGVTLWVRFAYEMNGDWMDYGHQPDQYIRVWRELVTASRAVANNTFFLWSPNINSNGASGINGYTAYYPGAQYVDLAGLSFYWLGDRQITNELPTRNFYTDSMSIFYNLYGSAHPIVLAETAAPFHYQVPVEYQHQSHDTEIPGGAESIEWDGLQPSEGNAQFNETGMKMSWYDRISGPEVAALYPNLVAVLWFNFAKIGGANGVRRLNDFRAIKEGSDNITTFFRGKIGSEEAYQLFLNPPAPTTTTTSESATGPLQTNSPTSNVKSEGSAPLLQISLGLCSVLFATMLVL